jgi:hypothetical protein
MNSAHFGNDQRKSFRCPVAESRQRCALLLDTGPAPGRLLDESAGGFSVLVACAAEPNVGQTVKIETDSGWFSVRVAHVSEAPQPADTDAATLPESAPRWFRLGLVRLREIPPPQPLVSVFAESPRVRLQQWCPSGGLLTSTLVLMTLLAVPVVLTAVIRHTGQHVPKSKSGDDAINLRVPGFDVDPPALLGGSKSKQFRQAAHDVQRSLEDAIRRLDGTTATIAPEVARQLRLTEAQVAKLGRIGIATEEALRKLGSVSGLKGEQSLAASKRRAALLERAHAEMMDTLTEQQRAEWQRLIGTPAATERPVPKTVP